MRGPGLVRNLIGAAIVLIGLIWLLARFVDVDLGRWWPLFVIVPGGLVLLTGLAAAPGGGGTALVVAGAQLTGVGVLLLFQNWTGLWPTWAYAWALIWPGSIGVGLALRGSLSGDPRLLRLGTRVLVVGVGLFAAGFILFESLLNVSGGRFGIVADLALPAVLIGLGLFFILRRR